MASRSPAAFFRLTTQPVWKPLKARSTCNQMHRQWRLQPHVHVLSAYSNAGRQAGRQAGRHLGVTLEAPRHIGECAAAVVLLDP